ncbi:GNAT family N-acetyltransferase [Collimonas pratensis]|uniref:GNAT family N-acetyltransferase n=1 Tax=Collimonas pratensis TaxID=279113 RepID=UPI000B1BECE2|nr:GNAT family N-acetyltransferase [Collimonas pratensis]
MKTTILNREYLWRNPEESLLLLSDTRKMLTRMSDLYPDFKKWFDTKVRAGVDNGSRSIILAHANGVLAGVAIVKDTKFEQKLCCLRVVEDFNGSGLGLKLFEKAFDVLKNENPLLSVSEEHYETFAKIFRHYGFEFGKAYDELYRPKKIELSFNGLLVPENTLLEKATETIDCSL